MKTFVTPAILGLLVLCCWMPTTLKSQGVFDLQPNRDRRAGLSALGDCIAAQGFAKKGTIKPNGDENVIVVDVTNIWDITITGVMVVPLGPLAEEHFSRSWFVFEFDPPFLRPSEVRTHMHSFQGMTEAFPEQIEVDVAVVNVRNIRPRWILADFDSPWPFVSQSERFDIAKRVLCNQGAE